MANNLEYINQYQKDNYDRITVMAEKGKKEEWKAAAKLMNVSLSQFVMNCVNEKIMNMKK